MEDTVETTGKVWAVIDNGTVVNTVVWDGESDWSPPEGTELVSLADHPGVGIGWDYVDGTFVDNRPVEDNEED
jgi:hypothetical protein